MSGLHSKTNGPQEKARWTETEADVEEELHVTRKTYLRFSSRRISQCKTHWRSEDLNAGGRLYTATRGGGTRGHFRPLSWKRGDGLLRKGGGD
ncbi:unnamed protein product [Pieris brassicae]|uniref:Uncharacterized protein n=1 Tax=Pieris brassicae TaxID=7116 RepID=A0A9P0TJT2_PIEBR|nr:unnamed protein product [Pieris brassicae]